MTAPTTEEMLEALKDVFDPELGYNIVDLGLVYGATMKDAAALVTMTLTTPGCPASDVIQAGVRQRLEEVPGVEMVDIDLVWDPAWSPQSMSRAAKDHFGIEDE
ncbi:MAG TPA: metal-sulfur cluster assembly factor [Burkholderiaceae bacterium]|nr:metal-sulfur cluster assembly factor [Burkholderiaceae bacterium]HRP27681.1 metal-sulfur cluster assembly factor [Burkholderiaceae bacterium]